MNHLIQKLKTNMALDFVLATQLTTLTEEIPFALYYYYYYY